MVAHDVRAADVLVDELVDVVDLAADRHPVAGPGGVAQRQLRDLVHGALLGVPAVGGEDVLAEPALGDQPADELAAASASPSRWPGDDRVSASSTPTANRVLPQT